MTRLWIALAMALTLAACPEQDAGSGANETRVPLLAVGPEVLDLGQVQVGETATAEVTISNVGDGYLTVEVPGDISPFAVVGPETLEPIGPLESTTLTIEYAPLQNENVTATLRVVSVVPTGIEETVQLRAEGLGPELRLSPDSHGFLSTQIGCIDSVVIRVANVGRAPLELLDLRFEQVDGTGALTLLPGYPGDGDAATVDLTLGPDQDIQVRVEYAPTEAVVDVGALRVFSDDPEEDAEEGSVAAIYGFAAEGPLRSDTFRQDLLQVDFLVVVDDRISMVEEQEALASNLPAVFASVADQGLDYRVVVTTTTPPPEMIGSEPIIDPWLADPAATFAENVAVGASSTGLGAGFGSAWFVLSGLSYEDTDHPGFWRQRAPLKILFVSDGDDHSLEVNLWSSERCLEEIQGLKPHPSLVQVADVTGGLDGCDGPGGAAEPGTNYLAGSQATGGVSASICDPAWSDGLLGWTADFAPTGDTFFLERPAQPGSAEVQVDGIPVTEGWEYDPELEAVVFSPFQVPEHDAWVRIDYRAADCSD